MTFVVATTCRLDILQLAIVKASLSILAENPQQMYFFSVLNAPVCSPQIKDHGSSLKLNTITQLSASGARFDISITTTWCILLNFVNHNI